MTEKVDRITDPFAQLTLEQQKEIAAYYIRARDILNDDSRSLNVLLRVDDTFIWVLPQAMTQRQIAELTEKWDELVSGDHPLVIVDRTVFLPRMDILYSAQPRPNPGASQ